jgi:hypothetical protein
MYRLVLSALCLIFLIAPHAHVSSYFENPGDWFFLPHPEILSFSIDARGDASGLVLGNIPFRQYTILEETGLRIQRFEIENHYHFIVNGTIVYSVNDLSTLLVQHSAEEAPV